MIIALQMWCLKIFMTKEIKRIFLISQFKESEILMSTNYILSSEFLTTPDAGIDKQPFSQNEKPEGGLFQSVFTRLQTRLKEKVEEEGTSPISENGIINDSLAGFLLGAGESVESTNGKLNGENEKAFFAQGGQPESDSLLDPSPLEGEIEGTVLEESEGENIAAPSNMQDSNTGQNNSSKAEALKAMGLNASLVSKSGGADAASSGKEDLSEQMINDKDGLQKRLSGSGGNGEGDPWSKYRFDDAHKGQGTDTRKSVDVESDKSRGNPFKGKGPLAEGTIAFRESGSKGAHASLSGNKNPAGDLAFKGHLSDKPLVFNGSFKGENSEIPNQASIDSILNGWLKGEVVSENNDLNSFEGASFRAISKIEELIKRDRFRGDKNPPPADAPKTEKGSGKEIQKNDLRIESLYDRDFIKPQVSNDRGDEIFQVKGKNHSVLLEDRILDQVKDGLRIILKRGGNGIRIRLHPPSLGQLRMEVSVNSDSVRTLMVAESDVVKGIIEANVNQLKQAFKEQGLRMEQFNVHVNNGQGQGGMASSNWSFKQGGDVPFSETLLNPEGDKGLKDGPSVLEKAVLADQKINIFV
jgi:hypothetical protein